MFSFCVSIHKEDGRDGYMYGTKKKKTCCVFYEIVDIVHYSLIILKRNRKSFVTRGKRDKIFTRTWYPTLDTVEDLSEPL